jgi:hypothetical protein
MLPQPKPRPRQSVQRANRRVAAKIVRAVRAACVERDGTCRYALDAGAGDIWATISIKVMECDGESQWAHLEDKRRFKTRGLPPEERHTTRESVMLCQRHHDDYDDRKLTVEFLTERGADGPLAWRRT